MLRIENDQWFDPFAAEGMVQGLWFWLLRCRADRDMEPLRESLSPGLYASECAALLEDAKAGRDRLALDPGIRNAELSYMGAEEGRERLLCRMLTRFTPRIVERDTLKVLSEGPETFFREEWELSRPEGTLTRPPSGIANEICPGCGSELRVCVSCKCPVCGTFVKIPKTGWVVDGITVREERDP